MATLKPATPEGRENKVLGRVYFCNPTVAKSNPQNLGLNPKPHL